MARHELLGGMVQVYRRGGQQWHCSASIDGRQYRATTGEDDLVLAKQAAEDWFLGLRGKSKAGLLMKERTFRQAADQFLKEYEVITEGHRSPRWISGYADRLRLHVLPFFGNMGLSAVTPGKVQEYRVHRISTSPTGKAPARSTIHDEIVTIRQVLKTAIRHEWLTHLPDFSPPYKTSGKVVHRPWFSPEEYKQLFETTRAHAKAAVAPHHRWFAEQLHDYVLFLGNTGLRPDEAKNLQHRDVAIVEEGPRGARILEIEVRGKRGVGYCKSTPMAVVPYERLLNRPKYVPQGRAKERNRKRNPRLVPPPQLPEPTDHVFPGNHLKQFNRLLDKSSLKLDRDGKPRTAYSLRHTYICMRLMEGADVYQIAKNCRTSVEMIEKFYAAHIKNVLDAAAINVRRSKAKKGKKTQPLNDIYESAVDADVQEQL